jgi:hypothetical protein
LAIEAMVSAAAAAAGAGHAELAWVLFEALMARDLAAATAVLANPSVAEEVFVRWQAAEDIIREEEARWPELQQLLVGIAGVHQQLHAAAAAAADQQLQATAAAADQQLPAAAAADQQLQATAAGVTASASNGAGQAVGQQLGEAAGEAATSSASATSTAMADLAQLAQHAAPAAAPAAAATSTATQLPAGDEECAAGTAVGEGQAGSATSAGNLHAQQGQDTTALADAVSAMHT